MLEKNEDLCYASLDMPTDKHRPGPKKKRQLNTDFSTYSEVSTGSNFNVEMLLSSVPVVHCCLHSLFISCCQHLFLCTWMINLVGLCCTLLNIVFFYYYLCVCPQVKLTVLETTGIVTLDWILDLNYLPSLGLLIILCFFVWIVVLTQHQKFENKHSQTSTIYHFFCVCVTYGQLDYSIQWWLCRCKVDGVKHFRNRSSCLKGLLEVLLNYLVTAFK